MCHNARDVRIPIHLDEAGCQGGPHPYVTQSGVGPPVFTSQAISSPRIYEAVIEPPCGQGKVDSIIRRRVTPLRRDEERRTLPVK
jgi:hypothetical protein